MKKIKDLILRHKGLSVVVFLALILFVLMLVILISLLLGGAKDEYGDRLEGIEKVEISKKTYSKLEDTIKENDIVSDVEYRLQGRIVYIDIMFTSEASVDDAKDVCSNSLEVFDEDEIAFYDFEFVISQEDAEEGFVLTGTKHPDVETIGWINS